MMNRNIRTVSLVLLKAVITVPAFIPMVSSSVGYIRINSTSASIPNQYVQAGGNVNLYFGDVTWSGSQLYLLMSYDANPHVSTGDVIYTPSFLIEDLTSEWYTRTYASGMGTWSVGNYWINGSIAPNIPVGEYTIKAFDDVEDGAAVTDTYITVYSVPSAATLEFSPPSGPGGVNATLTGSYYPPSASVTIAYYDPTFGSWNFLGTTTANAAGDITFTTEIPDLRRAQGVGDNPQTYAQVSYRSEINGIVYSYADYNQYARGLIRVGNQIANGLYGNGTNFVPSVRVEAGDQLTISGQWFHPGVVYVRWDSTAIVGTVTRSEWQNAVIIGTAVANQQTGYFETTVTIPAAEVGEHFLSIEDSETNVILIVYHEGTPKTLTDVSISTSSSSTVVGFQVEIEGSLRDVYGNGLSHENVVLYYTSEGTSTWTPFTSAQTDSSGQYSAVWVPQATGYFTVKAEWAGNETHYGSNSITTINSITFDGQYVFSVESNSIISELSFDSNNRTLSFNAQGDSGTQGYAKIIIAKTLVTDLEDITVYLDGNQVEYTVQSADDSWCLIINYAHSTHQIVVALDTSIIPEFTSTIIIPLTLASIIAIIVYKKKQKPT